MSRAPQRLRVRWGEVDGWVGWIEPVESVEVVGSWLIVTHVGGKRLFIPSHLIVSRAEVEVLT